MFLTPGVILQLFADYILEYEILYFQITPGSGTGVTDLPPMPEPEGTILKNHLKQVTYEPRSEKTGLWGFQPGPTQLGCTATEDG